MNVPRAIVRLKRNTRLSHKDAAYKISRSAGKIYLPTTQTVTETKKDRLVLRHYGPGATPISCASEGIARSLRLVAPREKNMGGCHLLVKSKVSTTIQAAKWTFKGYGPRWKIEEGTIK